MNLNEIIESVLFEREIPAIGTANPSVQRVSAPSNPGLSSTSDANDYEIVVNVGGQGGSFVSKSGGFNFTNQQDLANHLAQIFRSGLEVPDATGALKKSTDFNAIANYLIKVKGLNNPNTKDVTKDGKIIEPRKAD